MYRWLALFGEIFGTVFSFLGDLSSLVVVESRCWLQAGRNSQGIINAVAGFAGPWGNPMGTSSNDAALFDC